MTLDATLKPEQRHKLLIVSMLIRIWNYRYQLRNWTQDHRGRRLLALFCTHYTEEDELRYWSEALTNSVNAWEILNQRGWIQDPKQRPESRHLARIKEGTTGAIIWLGVPKGESGSYLRAIGDDAAAELHTALADAALWQEQGAQFLKELCPAVGEKLEASRGSFVWLGQHLTPSEVKLAEGLIAQIHPNGQMGISQASFTLLAKRKAA